MDRLGDLRRALRYAKGIGCTVVPVRRTDEVRVTHPRVKYAIRIKKTRGDTPRCLLTLINQVEAAG